MFFRGKTSVRRLQEMLEADEIIEEATGPHALSLFNRLEHLKKQRDKLKGKQGLLFRDKDLDLAIDAIEADIENTQSKLKEAKKMAEKKR